MSDISSGLESAHPPALGFNIVGICIDCVLSDLSIVPAVK
jgi:hypothetical protein